MTPRTCAACGSTYSGKLHHCPTCGADRGATEAKPARPLNIGERPGYCDNTLCNEIRAAYSKSQHGRTRTLREPGED